MNSRDRQWKNPEKGSGTASARLRLFTHVHDGFSLGATTILGGGRNRIVGGLAQWKQIKLDEKALRPCALRGGGVGCNDAPWRPRGTAAAGESGEFRMASYAACRSADDT